MLGFVDDEHGELLGLAHQTGDFGADGAVGGGARALGGQAELPGDERAQMALYMSRTLPVVRET